MPMHFVSETASACHSVALKSPWYCIAMNATHSLENIGSDELIANLHSIVRRSNQLTGDLLAHLAEVERRGLHLDAGCSSMFVYCTEVLRLSESAAYKRITAARAATRFPVLYEMIASGALHLAGLWAGAAPHGCQSPGADVQRAT